MGKTFRFTPQEALATGRPCRGDRELQLADVFAAELEGDLGSPSFVPRRQVRLERTLPGLHRQIGLGGEPGRLGERLEVCRPESPVSVGSDLGGRTPPATGAPEGVTRG